MPTTTVVLLLLACARWYGACPCPARCARSCLLACRARASSCRHLARLPLLFEFVRRCRPAVRVSRRCWLRAALCGCAEDSGVALLCASGLKNLHTLRRSRGAARARAGVLSARGPPDQAAQGAASACRPQGRRLRHHGAGAPRSAPRRSRSALGHAAQHGQEHSARRLPDPSSRSRPRRAVDPAPCVRRSRRPGGLRPAAHVPRRRLRLMRLRLTCPNSPCTRAITVPWSIPPIGVARGSSGE